MSLEYYSFRELNSILLNTEGIENIDLEELDIFLQSINLIKHEIAKDKYENLTLTLIFGQIYIMYTLRYAWDGMEGYINLQIQITRRESEKKFGGRVAYGYLIVDKSLFKGRKVKSRNRFSWYIKPDYYLYGMSTTGYSGIILSAGISSNYLPDMGYLGNMKEELIEVDIIKSFMDNVKISNRDVQLILNIISFYRDKSV